MPKSETVWFEEVDRGLLKLFSSLQIPVNGVLSPVYVDVKKSDEDFKVDVYPSISIYCSNYSFDKSRESTLKEEITEFDANSNIGKLEAVPQPYKFTYKITLWSKLQSQMNYMSRMLNSMLGHFHNLDVFDVSGNPTTVFMELKNPIVKSDMLLESERTFQHVYTYEIWTNIDERIQKDVYITNDTPVTIRVNDEEG